MKKQSRRLVSFEVNIVPDPIFIGIMVVEILYRLDRQKSLRQLLGQFLNSTTASKIYYDFKTQLNIKHT